MTPLNPTEHPDFDPSETWVNYGDVNPEPHGGRFIKYDADAGQWLLVETINMADIDPSAGEDCTRHHVEKYWLEPQDVWVDGDPDNGFSDAIQDILESLHEHGGLAGDSPEPDSPQFMGDVSYYLADITHYQYGSTTATEDTEDYADGYDEMIAEYGVDDYE